MATDGARLNTANLSGEQSQFRRTVLKRGSATITLDSATTSSTGDEGSVSIDITDCYLSTITGDVPNFVLPKAEVSLVGLSSGSGYPSVMPLPFTKFTTANAVEINAYYDITYQVDVIPTERAYVYLNVYLRLSDTEAAAWSGINTIYYTIYSEGIYAFNNWDYRA